VSLVLFLIKELGDLLQTVQAQNLDGVLLVAGELLENGNEFVDNDVLCNDSCEVADSACNGSSNHGGFFVAELDKLSKQLSG